MEQYNRLAVPRFRRVTIRFSMIEIELRARPRPLREEASPEEKAYRRARSQSLMSCRRQDDWMRWALRV